MVNSYHVNFAVISCEGLDIDAGYTDSREDNAVLKRTMMASAKKVILAVDNEKFGKTSFISVGKMSEIDTLVTEKDPGEQWKVLLEENKVELIIAN